MSGHEPEGRLSRAKAATLIRGGRCPQCKRGIIETDEYDALGRPRYGCSHCGYSFTNGHAGEDWDSRARNAIEGCNCTTCERVREMRHDGMLDAAADAEDALKKEQERETKR